MPNAVRSYADPCGVARALDAVGERWALLVVRELSLGPRRFGQLRTGLPDVSPNVLSQRLRELEAAGVVDRYELAPPANTTVYQLTARGAALDPVLQALGRWGARQPEITTREMSPVSFVRSLRVLVHPRARDGEYHLVVDGEPFLVAIDDGFVTVERADVHRPGAAPPEATLAGGVATLRRVLLHDARMQALETSGELVVTGDRRAAARLIRSFALPRL